MIYEFRTYTFAVGQAPKYLNLVRDVGKPVRGDNFGRNHGYWSTELGPLNQVWHLWSFDSLDERARLRAELNKQERWVKEFIPNVRPLLQRQDIRLMNPVIEPRTPASEGNIYEIRIYRTKIGLAKQWTDLISEYLPAREQYSKIVGLFYVEAPQPNEVLHIWAYKDLNARAEARGAAMEDPKWQEFLGKSGPMLEEMQSIALLPAPFSPLK
jgi:hypothetical protein